MTVTRYNFESGTDNTNVATGGGIVAVSGSPPKYQTEAAFGGSMGIESIGVQWAEWNAPTTTDWSGSVYVRPKVNAGTGSTRFVVFRTSTPTSGGGIRFHSDGSIQIVDSAGLVVGASASTTWAVNDEFRLDWQHNDTGTDTDLTLRIFKNANINGATPDEELTRTILLLSTAVVRIGGATTGTWDLHWDDLALSDTLEWIFHAGSASGTWTFAGTASGTRTPKGSAAGTLAYVGTASGVRTPKATADGTLAYSGTASGVRAPVGSATGTLDYAGTASGLTTHSGTAAGSWSFTGAAEGEAPASAASGSASGTLAWSGTAVGTTARRGSATGSVAYVGTAAGITARSGSSSGAWAYVGSAVGVTQHRGTATGGVAYVGAAHGKASRDITVTATLAPQRWSATIAPPTRSATIAPQRWAASIAPPKRSATIAPTRYAARIEET